MGTWNLYISSSVGYPQHSSDTTLICSVLGVDVTLAVGTVKLKRRELPYLNLNVTTCCGILKRGTWEQRLLQLNARRGPSENLSPLHRVIDTSIEQPIRSVVPIRSSSDDTYEDIATLRCVLPAQD